MFIVRRNSEYGHAYGMERTSDKLGTPAAIIGFSHVLGRSQMKSRL